MARGIPALLIVILAGSSLSGCGEADVGAGKGTGSVSAHLVFPWDRGVDGVVSAEPLAYASGTPSSIRISALRSDNDAEVAFTTIPYSVRHGSLDVPAASNGTSYTIRMEGLDEGGLTAYANRRTDVMVRPNQTSHLATVLMLPGEGRLYYKAENGLGEGYDDLRSFDGTLDQVVGASDFPGWNDSLSIANTPITVFNKKLYFMARSPYSSGYQLWTYDGAAVPHPAVGGDYLPGDNVFPMTFAVYKGKLYFNSFDAGKSYESLYEYDGTGVPPTTPAGAPLEPSEMTVFNGKLVMSGAESSTRRLFVWDGQEFAQATTAAGAYSYPRDLTVFRGDLLFSAMVGPDRVLCRYDGTSVSPVDTGVAITGVSGLMVFRGRLFFSGDGGNGALMWSCDMTPGASSHGPIRPSSKPSPMAFKDKLYFQGVSGPDTDLMELTASHVVTNRNVEPSASTFPYGMAVYNGSLYFGGYSSGFNSLVLWSYTGTGAPTEGTVEGGALPYVPSGTVVFSVVDPPAVNLDGTTWSVGEAFAASSDGCYGHTAGDSPYYQMSLRQAGNNLVIQGTLAEMDGTLLHDGTYNAVLLGRRIQHRGTFTQGPNTHNVYLDLTVNSIGGGFSGTLRDIQTDAYLQEVCSYESTLVGTLFVK